MKFLVLELTNPKWDNYINSSYIYDFHHTSCFHKIEIKEEDKALLFVAETDDEFVALPLTIKAIPSTKYFDAISVYGYCGPISSKKFSQISRNLIFYFQKKFKEYCNNNSVIAVFSRLHPLIDQNDFFHDFGKSINLNKTVAIDLTLPLDVQRMAFRKSNKSNINQLKKKKGYVVEAIDKNDKENIKNFVSIYLETMERVNAKKSYFFDFNYFFNLLNNDCFNCTLLAAFKEGVMASGSLFTETNTIMQYHLSGTKEEYFRDKSMTLLLDEARILATQRGLHFLHLGGGVDGSDEDSLFHFKAGFSKNFFQFSVWNLIVDQQAYDELVVENNLQTKETQFFPKYRVNSKK